MSHIIATTKRVIHAPAAQIYAVIADYEVGHPAILPKPYFAEMRLLKGGQGAGTEIEVDMEVLGVKVTHHITVIEPEPGRIIGDVSDVFETHFILDPLENGNATNVTITSKMQISGGIQGMFERLFMPMILRHIFNKELQLLDDYMRNVVRVNATA